jgi:probable HAF family extracellular repeat protein
MGTSFASSLLRLARAAFNHRPAEPRRRPDVHRARRKTALSPEPLEDRQLMSSYAVLHLGSLGGTATVPLALNNQGEVVGWSSTAGNETAHAFRYRKGRLTDLGTLGGKLSSATGINNRGEIVGMSNVALGSSQVDAFLERGGKLTDRGPLYKALVVGGRVSINDAGAIDGLSQGWPDASIVRGKMSIDVGSLGGQGSIGRDINDRGQVVGASVTEFRPAASRSTRPTVVYHAFIDDRGAINDLGTLGGTNSSANDINDRGSVVGFSDTANDAAIHAFRDTPGRMTDLGTLGGRDSVAEAINNEGDVVGSAQTGATVSHGYIDRHGRMIDLNSLIPADSGIVITNAEDINDRGEIAAVGYQTSSPSVHLGLLLKPAR